MNVYILKVGKCLSKKLKIMDNKNINKTNINWDILTHEKLRFQIQEMIKLTKDLIVRSSTEEFITFKLQEKDKGIQVRYENEQNYCRRKTNY